MDVLSRLWPLPLGFLAGLLAVPFLFRWLLLVLASLGRLPAYLGTRAQRPRRVGLVPVLLHPVPWLLLLGFAVGVPGLIDSSERVEWLGFLAGLVAAPAINGLLVYRALRRARRG